MGLRSLIAPVAALVLAHGPPVRAHEIELPVAELDRSVRAIERTIAHYRERPVFEPMVSHTSDHRRVLGAAEIDFALGDGARALRLLLAQAQQPKFRQAREYVPTLLLISEILERSGDDYGAMHYARKALENGGDAEAMAEAGARWFKLARRWQRLAPRREVYELWRRNGGQAAAAGDEAAGVLYEAAFAARALGQAAEAQRLLAQVPSGSPHGSRAAYLAAVVFVGQGDLGNAERWFSAVMEWPIPARFEERPTQRALEREVRELAALSAGRLRYEGGRLEEAMEAYGRVPETSVHFREACWEQAFLTLELEQPRRTMDHLKCVQDLGASGKRHVDARLFEASLLAHLGHYERSLERYDLLHRQFEREHAAFAELADRIEDPARFLFDAMERSASDDDPNLSPGAPTLFGDAWTKEVDSAYRIDSGLDGAVGDSTVMEREVAEYLALLQNVDSFPQVRFRRENINRLLVEIDHLIGHAGDLSLKTHASLELTDAGGHPAEQAKLRELMTRLRQARTEAQAELTALLAEAERQLRAARAELTALDDELARIRRTASTLRREADDVADTVARASLEDVEEHLAGAAMRAEVGVLDTFWLKKQERTRAIERLLAEKKEAEAQIDEARRIADQLR